MKLSAKTGVALTITALSLVVTVGAGASDTVEPANARLISCCTAYSEAGPATPVTTAAGTSDSVEPVDAWVIHCCTAYSEEVPSTSVTPLPTFFVTPLSASAAHVGLMNQLRNLTEPNAIALGWSKGLANDQASAGTTQYSGSTARILTR